MIKRPNLKSLKNRFRLPAIKSKGDPLLVGGLVLVAVGALLLASNPLIHEWAMSNASAQTPYWRPEKIASAAWLLGWAVLISGVVFITRCIPLVKWGYWSSLIVLTAVVISPYFPMLPVSVAGVVGIWGLSLLLRGLTSDTYQSTIYVKN